MNIRLAQTAVGAIVDRGFERQAGYCLRFVRQCVQKTFGAQSWPVPQGLDAKQSADWLKLHRPKECGEGVGTIGSVLFYAGPHHGPHGHVVIRVAGNKVAENSTAHAPEGHDDGRGYRPLSALGDVYLRWEVPQV